MRCGERGERKSKKVAMPRKKNEINYPLFFIVRVIEEWEANQLSDEPDTQVDYAARKGINLRTFRSWLQKRKREEMVVMTNSNQISAPRRDEKKEEKDKIVEWVEREGVSSVPGIVAQITKETPSLVEGKGYDCKRRIAERIRDTRVKREEGFEYILKNRVSKEIEEKLQKPCTRKCKCKRRCGPSCPHKAKMIECDDTICDLGDACGNRNLQEQWKVEDVLERRDTDDTGFGVFALKKVSARHFVCEYRGEVIDESEAEARAKRHRSAFLMHLDGDFTIDAFKCGSIARYINHSCSPNAKAVVWYVKGIPRVAMYSTKVIQPGDEVTFHYGDGYEFSDCRCAKCTKTKGAKKKTTSPHEDEMKLSIATGELVVKGMNAKYVSL